MVRKLKRPKCENESNTVRPGVDFGAAGGFGGTGVSGFDPTRSKNAMHPAGCGGCFFDQRSARAAMGPIYSVFLS